MSKATPKTIETTNSVLDFIKSVPDARKQQDSLVIMEMMKEQTGFEPKMWGPAIIGFGTYHYKYKSGHEGDCPIIGFSPRKEALTLYLCPEFDEKEALLREFGKHKTSKACIYVKKLEDINVEVLKKMIAKSLEYFKANYK